MAIDAECGTRGTKSRGAGKGNKKVLECFRNTGNNNGVVLEETKENVFSVNGEDSGSTKACISENGRINKPGPSTETARENPFEDMERIREEGEDGLIYDGKGLDGNKRCTGINERSVNYPGGRQAGGDCRAKGKAAIELCTAVNLFAKAVSTDELCTNNSCGKHGNRSGAKNSGLRNHDTLPNCTHNVVQNNVVSTDALSNGHYGVSCKGKAPTGISKACNINVKKKFLQREAPIAAQNLVVGQSNMASTSKKNGVKGQGKCCFNNATNKSFDRSLEVSPRAEDTQDPRKRLWKKTTTEGLNANCINTTSNESSCSKNKNLVCRRKGIGEAKQHGEKCYCDEGLVTDNRHFTLKQKKRKAEKVIGDGQVSHRDKFKTPKLKRHGTDVKMNPTKKQRCSLQSTASGHSSISSPETALPLVSSKGKNLITADKTHSGFGKKSCHPSDCYAKTLAQADSEGNIHKKKGGVTSKEKHFTVDQFFSAFDSLLFNKTGSDQAPKEPNPDHGQTSFDVNEDKGGTAHVQSQSNALQRALANDKSHGKNTPKEKRPAKNKRYDSCPKKITKAKNQSSHCKSQLGNRTVAKSDGVKLRYEQAIDSSRNHVKLTKGTFDLATVFYDGIREKYKVKMGEQACVDDDCRITCVKSKRANKQGESDKRKPTRKRLSTVDHSAKKAGIDFTSVKKSRQQDSIPTCSNSNKYQSELEILPDEPSTSKDYYVDSSTITKGTNSADTDCPITYVNSTGDRMAMLSQQRSLIDAIIEATTMTAKPYCSSDIKALKQTHMSHRRSDARGNKRKSSAERFEYRAFKKALINDKDNLVIPKGRRPTKRKSFDGSITTSRGGSDSVNRMGDIAVDATHHESYTNLGVDDQKLGLGLTNIEAVLPIVLSPSYGLWRDNEDLTVGE